VFDYPSVEEISEFLAAEGHTAPEPDIVVPVGPKRQPGLHGGSGTQLAARPAATPVFASLPAAAGTGLAPANLDLVLRRLRLALSAVLAGVPLPSDSAPLLSAGLLNSTAAVQFTAALETAFGARLPATLVFDYPSLSAIADYIMDEVSAGWALVTDSGVINTGPGHTAASPSDDPPPLIGRVVGFAATSGISRQPSLQSASLVSPPPAAQQPLVTITAACHMAPGGSLDGQPAPGFTHAASMWQAPPCSVPRAHDRSAVPPLARWDVEAEATAAAAAAGEQLPMRFGSFVAGAEMFDAAAFGLSRAEALLMGEL
jgi:hypothetical protein